MPTKKNKPRTSVHQSKSKLEKIDRSPLTLQDAVVDDYRYVPAPGLTPTKVVEMRRSGGETQVTQLQLAEILQVEREIAYRRHLLSEMRDKVFEQLQGGGSIQEGPHCIWFSKPTKSKGLRIG